MTPNMNAEPPMQPKGWFSRNWKWLLPVGCMVPMVCCGVFGLGTYFAVTKVIQSSGAYVGAIAMVNSNSQVDDVLGTPVTPGLGMSGSVNEKGSGGEADFTVPVEGTRAKGSMHVVATRRNGQWSYTTIEITAGAKTINVLEGNPEDLPDVPPEETPEPEEPAGD